MVLKKQKIKIKIKKQMVMRRIRDLGLKTRKKTETEKSRNAVRVSVKSVRIGSFRSRVRRGVSNDHLVANIPQVISV